jgi:hypothetical protein
VLVYTSLLGVELNQLVKAVSWPLIFEDLIGPDLGIPSTKSYELFGWFLIYGGNNSAGF